MRLAIWCDDLEPAEFVANNQRLEGIPRKFRFDFWFYKIDHRKILDIVLPDQRKLKAFGIGVLQWLRSTGVLTLLRPGFPHRRKSRYCDTRNADAGDYIQKPIDTMVDLARTRALIKQFYGRRLRSENDLVTGSSRWRQCRKEFGLTEGRFGIGVRDVEA